MSEKTYWIGDSKDEKSCVIDNVFYLPGEVIPADKVDPDRLANWKAKGLVSGGVNSPPVVVKDTETVNRLEAEIRDLKVKLDAMPGLENQNKELKAEIDKVKKGKKADAVKALEADVEEKAALIEKHAARIAELEADLEAATAPGNPGGDDTGGDDLNNEAGPGGA